MSDSRPEQSDTDDETPLETIVAGATTGLILTVAFGLLFAGVPWFWVAFPVGFGGLLPMAMGLAKLYERRQTNRRDSDPVDGSTTTDQEALETLRNRYARGEIDDEEFEQRLAALLETESVDDATAYAHKQKARE